MSYVEDRHAIVGIADQEPLGLPGVVAALPDDWLPSPKFHGTMVANVAAGGAGFRSEILCGFADQSENVALELFDLWVASQSAGGSLEIVATISATGFTASGFRGHDLRLNGTGGAALFTKNTAAATTAAGNRLTGGAIFCVTADVFVYVPGFRVIMLGGSEPRTILIRGNADNQGVRAMVGWRVLEKRKL